MTRVTQIDQAADVVTLSDGTRWRVMPRGTPLTGWLLGQRVTVSGAGLTRELKNLDLGSSVQAMH